MVPAAVATGDRASVPSQSSPCRRGPAAAAWPSGLSGPARRDAARRATRPAARSAASAAPVAPAGSSAAAGSSAGSPTASSSFVRGLARAGPCRGRSSRPPRRRSRPVEPRPETTIAAQSKRMPATVPRRMELRMPGLLARPDDPRHPFDLSRRDWRIGWVGLSETSSIAFGVRRSSSLAMTSPLRGLDDDPVAAAHAAHSERRSARRRHGRAAA